ncbi:electron transfer flavoprotein subunit alpha/FixB family protein [Pseudazoarcus pumilus]|uniref:Electron transfer flavoprotein subunit alpha n=1 Tax=Pseudazoarcus pumilus TaxID=2067960 RepID=A0A2I6S6J0_9RHOO|nr:FAD-binding protein [Pseudazoarcus pumilus]AUN94875.1 electron transfer flavoprotein subunit alpha [Pseudazoarcus pumilus]
MNILVIAEHDNHALRPATAPTIAAARAIGGEVTLLVAGHDCAAVAQQGASLDGVARVLVADAPHYEHELAENLAALVLTLTEGRTHVLAPATTFGRNLMPRVAALLGVAQIGDVVEVCTPDTFVRPIYAGNALESVRSLDAVRVLTVRPTAFEAVARVTANAPVEAIAAGPDLALSRFVSRELTRSERPELGSARVVVSGGRGLGSAERFEAVLGPLAERLGAALGASRAAVDAGYVPNDLQVGQTGKIVAPELYVAVGISGAIQHLAGMKESRVIVAINKDAEAPIFQVADYGLVADLFQAVPELLAALERDG